jgi:predicted DNA-binding WGR domain protein
MNLPSDKIDIAQWRTVHFQRGERYYRLHIEQDLWGDWCLTRVNGRRGSALGRVVTSWSGAYTEVNNELQKAAERRRRRRYTVVSSP